ncbi:class III lanthipeptide [Bacillus sp. JCM 19041]
MQKKDWRNPVQVPSSVSLGCAPSSNISYFFC